MVNIDDYMPATYIKLYIFICYSILNYYSFVFVLFAAGIPVSVAPTQPPQMVQAHPWVQPSQPIQELTHNVPPHGATILQSGPPPGLQVRGVTPSTGQYIHSPGQHLL